MNLKKLVAVRDSKTEIFTGPVMVTSHAEAKRMFMDLVRDPQSIYHRHREDFTLYAVGSFDPTCGAVLPPETGCFALMRGDEVADKDKE